MFLVPLLLAVCLVLPTAPAQADPYHCDHYSFTINSGPIDGVGYNGCGIANFVDSSNSMDISATGGRAWLDRVYDLTFVPDPGWAFTTLGMNALGQYHVGSATAKAGPMHYLITDPYSSSTQEGDLVNNYGTAQNCCWDYWSEFGFGTSSSLILPAGGFHLIFSTSLYLGTYNDLPTTADIALNGNSKGLQTFQLDFGALGPAPIQSTIPEPDTLFLLGTGLCGAAAYGRKKLRRKPSAC